MTEDDTFRILIRGPISEVYEIFNRYARDEIPTHAEMCTELEKISWTYAEAVGVVFGEYYRNIDQTQLKSS